MKVFKRIMLTLLVLIVVAGIVGVCLQFFGPDKVKPGNWIGDYCKHNKVVDGVCTFCGAQESTLEITNLETTVYQGYEDDMFSENSELIYNGHFGDEHIQYPLEDIPESEVDMKMDEDSDTLGDHSITFTYKGASYTHHYTLVALELVDFEFDPYPSESARTFAQNSRVSYSLSIKEIYNNGYNLYTEGNDDNLSYSIVTSEPGRFTCEFSYKGIQKELEYFVTPAVVKLDTCVTGFEIPVTVTGGSDFITWIDFIAPEDGTYRFTFFHECEFEVINNNGEIQDNGYNHDYNGEYVYMVCNVPTLTAGEIYRVGVKGRRSRDQQKVVYLTIEKTE